MDLRQLRYFAALAETLNFHRAAERLNMSQPPLSVAIRKLEDELGTELFIREPRGVRLSPAGEAAIGPALQVLAQVSLVRDAVRLGASGDTGRLVLGFVGSAVSELVPAVIPIFRNRYPSVELVLEEMTSVDILAALDQRRLDVGFVRLPVLKPSAARIDVIERDHLIAALPQDHRFAKSSRVSLRDLAEEQFILHSPVSVLRSVALLACQQAGFAPQVAQEITQVQAALSLVQSGLGIALVPSRMSRFAPDQVALRPLETPVAIEMGIARRVDASPAAANFVAAAMTACDTGSL